jgi:hypothetical protein
VGDEPRIGKFAQALRQHLIAELRDELSKFGVSKRADLEKTQDYRFPLSTEHLKCELGWTIEALGKSVTHLASLRSGMRSVNLPTGALNARRPDYIMHNQFWCRCKLARQQLARQWTAIQEEERQRDAASGKISTTEALEILEIEAGAPEQEIRAAYKRLMKRVIRMWVGRSIFPSN